MADFEHQLKHILFVVVLSMTVSEVLNGKLVESASATTIGDSDSALPSPNGDSREPIANEPERSLSEESEKNGAASVFGRFPTSTIPNLSIRNNDYIEEANALPVLVTSITDLAQIPDFADPLSAWDWVRRWADMGYWLEIDQWADFKAVAIAGYKPEIRYWLGRDSWAFVSSAETGIRSQSSAPNGISSRQYREAVNNLHDTSRGDPLDRPGIESNKRTIDLDQPATMTIRQLVGSMIRKLVEQPMFYVIFAFGFGLLLWALRQQKHTLQKQEPTQRRRKRRRTRRAPKPT